MGSLKVFGLPASTDVSRVLTCLFEKEVEFQLIRIDTYKKDHKVPEFLRLQDPSGQVTLKDGIFTFVDSREICRYVCEKYANQGNKTLYGTGGLERASIEQWLQSEARNFDPPSSALVFHLAFAVPMGLEPDEAVVNQNVRKLARVLDVYDQRLEDSKYLAGDEFTLADLSHLPNSHYLVDRSERGRELFYSRKNVARWWKEISSRPSWQQVVHMQSEHPGPLEKFKTID
uniref:glutathione transferase n=1 Tax=Dracaena cambodiana TaxID=580341 RepID=A0A173GPI1_9ASPA|nr:glutathione S-transferase [Dracaena cambodiana]